MKVGERIKARRIELGLTQEELAKRMGYSDKSAVCKAETSGDNITTSKINKFALHLNCSFDYLMGWESSTQETSNDTYYINDDAREMAQFLFDNPQYKVLFDASRKVKAEDIEKVAKMIEIMGGNNND